MKKKLPLKKPQNKTNKLAKEMRELVNWTLDDASAVITKTFLFSSYLSALAFIAKVAVHAEILNHHPTITFAYTSVTVSTTTHESGTLTKKDFELARKIDALKVHC